MSRRPPAVADTRAPSQAAADPTRPGWTTWSPIVVAVGIVASSAYGLVVARPYRDLSEATVIGAQAQDVCSLVVAGVLVLVVRHHGARVHVVRMGLLAYVAYSYSIYLVGIPLNRMFLVYVVLVSVSGAALMDGLVRLRPRGWPRTTHRRLERGTGWMLVAVAALFAGVWLSALIPFVLGGPPPETEGPGGSAYPVFVLDLVVVLPCIAVVGVLLLRGRNVAGPLATVVLVKIITLFTALWAGTVVALWRGVEVHLAADAGPSLIMLAACLVLVGRWLRVLQPDEAEFLRAHVWE